MWMYGGRGKGGTYANGSVERHAAHFEAHFVGGLQVDGLFGGVVEGDYVALCPVWPGFEVEELLSDCQFQVSFFWFWVHILLHERSRVERRSRCWSRR